MNMLMRFFISVIFIVSNLFVYSQLYNYDDYVKGAKQNDVFFDFRVGYPNWGAYNTQVYARSIDATTVSTGGLVPLSLRMEVMLSNELSFSFDGIINKWSGKWSYTPEIFDADFNPIGVPVTTEYDITRLRFQVGLNYHLDEVPVDNLNIYGGFAFGSNRLWTNVNTEDESFRIRSQRYFLRQDPLVNFPISLSLRVGMRYFVMDNLGFSLEAASGGATISGGIVYRLRNM